MPYTEANIGYRNTDTSQEAAIAIEPKAKTLSARVLNLLIESPVPLDSDEIACALREPIGSVQPRTSDLRRSGKIMDSGERGITPFGKSCIKWTVAK